MPRRTSRPGWSRPAFAAVAPGLEPMLREELEQIGVSSVEAPGGVSFTATQDALMRVHLWSRIAGRVTVSVGETRASSLEELARGAKGIPWRDYIAPGQRIEVKVTVKHATLRFADTIAKKLEYAAVDALRGPRIAGVRPPNEPAGFLCRAEGDKVYLSADASGDLLHRRGWRQSTAKAPIRENLAAAVLRALGWTPDEPLVDPMCGSGTFGIEAAGIALGHAPGFKRRFGFLNWPLLDRAAWEKLCSAARPEKGGAGIFVSDRDEGAIRATRENAERAHVTRRLSIQHVDVARLTAPPGPEGLVVANPPWGDRIEGSSSSWGMLGRTLRDQFGGWRVGVLAPERRFLKELGLKLEPVVTFPTGGTRITLFAGRVP